MNANQEVKVEEKEVKEIRIKIKVYQAENKEGKKFNYYKVVRNDGVLVTCKFRQYEEDGKTPILPPTENCIAVIDPNEINYQTNTEYPVCWIRKQPKYESIAHANKKDKVVDAFNNDEVTELTKKDLPF